MTTPDCATETAASLASRILAAWKQGPQTDLVRELDYAVQMMPMRHPDTLEMERMEVLEGAARSLRGGQQGQVRAAVQILEQLVNARESSLSR